MIEGLFSNTDFEQLDIASYYILKLKTEELFDKPLQFQIIFGLYLQIRYLLRTEQHDRYIQQGLDLLVEPLPLLAYQALLGSSP